MSRHGGKLLVDQLAVHGADTIFSVPGESFLALLDGLYESPIRLITCRHEAAAVHMADAWARLTGEVGIALVTGGPGHANAVSALYTALASESPMVLISGRLAAQRITG